MGDAGPGVATEVVAGIIGIGRVGDLDQERDVGGLRATAAGTVVGVGAAEDDDVGLGLETFGQFDRLVGVDGPGRLGEP